MKPTTLEQAVERLANARQAQERAERELRVAEEKVRRVREEILALGIDPDNLEEFIKKLETEITSLIA